MTKNRRHPDLRFCGGAKGTRPPDPHTASVVRYQLRHSPKSCQSKLHHWQHGFKVAGEGNVLAHALSHPGSVVARPVVAPVADVAATATASPDDRVHHFPGRLLHLGHMLAPVEGLCINRVDV